MIHQQNGALVGGSLRGTQKAELLGLTAAQNVPTHQGGGRQEILAAALADARNHIIKNTVLIKAHTAHIGIAGHVAAIGLRFGIVAQYLQGTVGRIEAGEAGVVHPRHI